MPVSRPSVHWLTSTSPYAIDPSSLRTMSFTPSEMAPTMTPIRTAVRSRENRDRLVLAAQERHRALEDHAADLLHLHGTGVAAKYELRQPARVEHGYRACYGY